LVRSPTGNFRNFLSVHNILTVMPTPFESAQLILSLYETRREETMRKARDFFFGFDPQTFDEMLAGMMGPQGAYVRMVIGYWDMAASFVENGAIDRKMFLDANGEFIFVFIKIEPFIAKLREMFSNPGFAAHLESLIMSMPNAQERLASTRERMKSMIASRAASAKA
jgi:hypothetical protein